jgi:hypothetical protein
MPPSFLPSLLIASSFRLSLFKVSCKIDQGAYYCTSVREVVRKEKEADTGYIASIDDEIETLLNPSATPSNN